VRAFVVSFPSETEKSHTMDRSVLCNASIAGQAGSEFIYLESRADFEAPAALQNAIGLVNEFCACLYA
jgi:hypothetical protein